MKQFYFLFLLILATSFSQLNADILYVKPGTSSTAWQNQSNVYSDLQSALTAAVAGDEVWVAAGIYKPTNDGDRDISFELKDGVHYYGGFVGNETELSQRDWNTNKTILSGDIGVEGDVSDNSYHVVKGLASIKAPITANTRLDGFIVESGNADQNGGALYLKFASPVISNTRFTNNQAVSGGAVYAERGSEARFVQCIFDKNIAKNGGAVYGRYSPLKFSSCICYRNYAAYRYGAFGKILDEYDFYVENSIFFNNDVGDLYDDFLRTRVECTFTISKDANHDRDGNFYANPLFVDPENGDFRIRQGSPAINAGSSESLADLLLTDYYGNSRIQDDTLDIGIFEGCVKTPVAKSPANKSVIESDVTEVSLEWEWENTMPENINGYELEYVLNGTDTIVFSNLQSLTHNISGLKKTDKVQWRVRGINDTEDKNWSSWFTFHISRGHPLYVKSSASGDGSSWANSMDLQNALNVAVLGDTIWVAAGIYNPTNEGDRSISFELKEGVHYYGGFAGDETELTQRDWNVNKTILSGDIGVEGDVSDNSYHVVTGMASELAPITANTRMDGFIVEKGNAENSGGGALDLISASPVISNTRFTNNQAASGGAVSAWQGSDARFVQCIFDKNNAKYNGGAVFGNSRFLKFSSCIWYGNYASRSGAIEVSGNDHLNVENSIFFNNEAGNAYDDFYWEGVECTFTISKNASYSSEGNFFANPLFLDPENGDFRLRQGSPAINAGSSENLPDWLLMDYYGNSRIQEDTLDIGVFEGFVKTPVAKSPANNSVIESEFTEVSLEWEWENTMPENIKGYELEYVLNDTDTFVVSNLQSLTHGIFGLKELDKVQWRVRGTTDTKNKDWSPWYKFYIPRGYALRVEPNGNGDGSSWLNSMDLQNALDIAVLGDTIWVASGTYKPTNDGDRSISFELKEGVQLFGGFSGVESSLEERNWYANKTILSGDIGVEDDAADNSFNVVKVMGSPETPITERTIIDGFIIKDGNSNSNGGALYLQNASSVISNIRFSNNQAFDGGAVYVEQGGEVQFVQCIFNKNIAKDSGGAVYGKSRSVKFSSCIFYGNYAAKYSGAITGYRTDLYVENSIFLANDAGVGADDFENNVNCDHSIFKNAWNSHKGNFDADPLFVDPENGNFFLQAGSPAINAGDNQYVANNIQTDFAGSERVFGDYVDIGAFEFRQPNNISPEKGTSATKDFSELGMVNFSWEVTDWQSDSITDFPDEYKWQIKIRKDGEEGNPVREGEVTTGNFMVEDNSTMLGGFDFGAKYHWQVGLDMGNYVVWSAPTSFYIGHDQIIYVKEDNTGSNGDSWANAFGTLHEALEYALPGDEIWVAKGVYHPVSPGDPNNVSQTEREESLSLKPGMLMYGGFAGDEVSLSQRSPNENTTIISGDIGVEGDISDNSIHLFNNEFVASSSLKREVIIDGFIMEGATGSAMYNVNASPSIEYCIFRNNEGENGAAVYNENSSPYFYNVLFYSNSATLNGGAIYGDEASNPELLNCTLGNNSASSGGGLYGSLKVRNSIVYANEGNQIEGSSDVAFSCVEDGFDGEGNIQFDPVWKDAENHNYQLTEFSSCIDQGDGSLISAMFSYDLAHNTRKHNFYVDMGAYEAQSIGKLEVVDSPLLNEEPVDFIDSITIRYNQPIKISADTVALVSPAEDVVFKVSEDDNTVLIIKHKGLESVTDYQLSFPYGYVELATNDMIVQDSRQFNFQTRACIPVVLSVENSDVAVCPQTSVILDAEISGDALDYFWVFNQDDTLSRNVDSLLIDTVMPQNTGAYVLKVTDWCGSSDEVTVNLQYKSGTELVVPSPKWNTVYFVDNNTGNLSDFKWYLNGEEVGTKQYLETKGLDYGELSVVAYDETSRCLVYGEVGSLKSASLKSLSVSPNPVVAGHTVDVILPQISEKSRIRLYDLKGSLLIEKEFGEGSILQLKDTDLASGVYLMQIEYNDGFIENKKLIIE